MKSLTEKAKRFLKETYDLNIMSRLLSRLVRNSQTDQA